MYDKILIPVDMSHTEKAVPMIEVAKKLAGENTQYILMSVIYQVPGYLETSIPQEYFEMSKEEARKTLKVLAIDSEIDAKVELCSGEAAHEILALSEGQKIEMIVIGSHRPGLSDYLLGSTAARVVRHAKCPVMVLR